MFDVGLWEIILIFGIGLIILGPERLPRVAAQLGLWIGRAQRTANQFRRKLQRELELDDLMRDGLVPRKRPPPPMASKATKTTPGSSTAASGRAGGASAGATSPSGPGEASAGVTSTNGTATVGDRDPAPQPPPGATQPAATQPGEASEAGPS